MYQSFTQSQKEEIENTSVFLTMLLQKNIMENIFYLEILPINSQDSSIEIYFRKFNLL